MRLPHPFARLFTLRRVARDLTSIARALEQQTALLTRLADRYAPVDAKTVRAEVVADTGVSHLDANDAALALAWSERTQRETGHVPEDEELAIYLADEKTQDLHARLVARESELSRLREAREW